MLRRDFRLWTLPGGGIDTKETPETAAVRETEEETGYLIKIERQIGYYTRPQFKDTRYLFLGKVIGGKPIEQGPETYAVKWFHLDQIPKNVFISTPELIQDFLANQHHIIERTQYYPSWQILVFQGLISIRNLYNHITLRPKS